MLEHLFSKAKKETPAQVFSCEYWEMFKKTYFEEHLRRVARRCIVNIVISIVRGVFTILPNICDGAFLQILAISC